MHRAFDAVCAKLQLSTGAGDPGEKDGDKGGINACAARCLGRTASSRTAEIESGPGSQLVPLPSMAAIPPRAGMILHCGM